MVCCWGRRASTRKLGRSKAWRISDMLSAPSYQIIFLPTAASVVLNPLELDAQPRGDKPMTGISSALDWSLITLKIIK